MKTIQIESINTNEKYTKERNWYKRKNYMNEKTCSSEKYANEKN